MVIFVFILQVSRVNLESEVNVDLVDPTANQDHKENKVQQDLKGNLDQPVTLNQKNPNLLRIYVR